jgi:hypothetical protein
MTGLSGTQALLIVLIILVFFLVFRRSERRPDYPWRPRPGWWPERRALRDYEENRR